MFGHVAGRKSAVEIPTTFVRTVQALVADSFAPSTTALLLIAMLLAAWVAWLGLARVPLYELADSGRIEVITAVRPVDAAVGGRVVSSRLEIGREVRPGEVLVELDRDLEQLRLREERTRLDALMPQLAALRSELAAHGGALAELEASAPMALAEAHQRAVQAEARADAAADYAERLRGLFARNLVSQLELVRAEHEAQGQRAAAKADRISVERLDAEYRSKEKSARAQIAQLERQRRLLEGQAATAAVIVARFEEEADRPRIRAPAGGRLAEVAPLRVGSVIRVGDKLGTIVPPGPLRAVVAFSPEALGRVHPGQPARLRFHGFPSTQYGTIPAVVENVAGEVREGRVRVELALHATGHSRIPLQHGLPASVEVEVERVSPAALALRVAGRVVGVPGASPGSTPVAGR